METQEMMSPTDVDKHVDEAQEKMVVAEKSLGDAYEKLSELLKCGVAIPGLSQFASGVLSAQVELSAAINDMYLFRQGGDKCMEDTHND